MLHLQAGTAMPALERHHVASAYIQTLERDNLVKQVMPDQFVGGSESPARSSCSGGPSRTPRSRNLAQSGVKETVFGSPSTHRAARGYQPNTNDVYADSHGVRSGYIEDRYISRKIAEKANTELPFYDPGKCHVRWAEENFAQQATHVDFQGYQPRPARAVFVFKTKTDMVDQDHRFFRGACTPAKDRMYDILQSPHERARSLEDSQSRVRAQSHQPHIGAAGKDFTETPHELELGKGKRHNTPDQARRVSAGVKELVEADTPKASPSSREKQRSNVMRRSSSCERVGGSQRGASTSRRSYESRRSSGVGSDLHSGNGSPRASGSRLSGDRPRQERGGSAQGGDRAFSSSPPRRSQQSVHSAQGAQGVRGQTAAQAQAQMAPPPPMRADSRSSTKASSQYLHLRGSRGENISVPAGSISELD